MFCEILKKYENINTSFGTDKNTTLYVIKNHNSTIERRAVQAQPCVFNTPPS